MTSAGWAVKQFDQHTIKRGGAKEQRDTEKMDTQERLNGETVSEQPSMSQEERPR